MLDFARAQITDRARLRIALRVLPFVFTLYYFFATGAFASLWAIPTAFLSQTTEPLLSVINSIGQTGGFFGPAIVGRLNDKKAPFAKV